MVAEKRLNLLKSPRRIVDAIAPAAVFVLLSLVAFFPGAFGPAILDDAPNLEIVMRDATSLHEILDLSLSNESGLLRRPFANASFVLSHQVFPHSMLAIKITNIILHGLVGYFLYQLLRLLTPALLPEQSAFNTEAVARVAAIAWTIHPIHVSAVVYGIQRMTLLSGLFTVTALLVASRALLAERSVSQLVIAAATYFALTLIAMLSKETGALTPLMLATIILTPKFRQAVASDRAKKFFVFVSVALPLLIGSAILVARWQFWMHDYPGRDFSLSERLATECVVLWHYLGHLTAPWPASFHFYWDATPIYKPTDTPAIVAGLAWITALIAATCLYVRRGIVWILFCLLWFLAGHALESSVLPLELAFEHRNYLPSVAVTIALGWLLSRLTQKHPAYRRSATVLIVGTLAIACAVRASTWSSSAKLAEHEYRLQPVSLRATVGVLNAAVQNGDASQAVSYLEELRQLTGQSAWTTTLELVLHCYGLPTKVRSTELRDSMIYSALSVQTSRAIPQLVQLELDSRCVSDQGIDLEEILTAMAAKSAQGSPALASDYLYQAAWLAFGRGDLESSEHRLLVSAALAPNIDAPLERLFHVQLLLGKLSEAQDSLERLRNLWIVHSPWRLYRLDAMEAELRHVDDSQPSHN